MKTKKIKTPKYRTEEQEAIRRFIIILGIVIVLVVGIYLFTKNVINKPKLDITDNSIAGEISYDKVIVGTMLNKQDTAYYVIAYDFENERSSFYSSLITKFKEDKKNLPMYVLDLNNALNKEYVATSEEKSNAKATKISDIKFKDVTLLKIKDGKMVKYLEGESIIKTELGL